jgi:predicted nucleic acid-binding protein
MSGGKDKIYWDSCIFLALLKGEIRQDPQDLFGIDELVDLFELGQIELVTSTITLTEVMRTSIKPEDYLKFRSFFSRRNCHLADVTTNIAEISEEIRSYYFQPGGSTISTPDCIHLATAISWPCDVFYTFDGEGNRPGLLTLTNPIANRYSIIISKPIPTHSPQLSLNI